MIPGLRSTCLIAKNTYIRPPVRSDFDAWSQVREASRGHLAPWEPIWPEDANSHRDWRGRMRVWRDAWRRDRGYAFLIFARKGDTLLGGVALSNVRRGPANIATLGYWLGQDAVGAGHMTEAVGLVTAWGLENVSLARIEAATVTDNHRSQQVLERCGFQREGIARSYLEIAGERRDHILYARLASDGKMDTIPPNT
ncbi:MAG: GNAT family protein [Pseudomonadota bacterium]